MLMSLSPQAANVQAASSISVDGDVITVDGVEYDLSPLPDGAEVPANDPFIGTIHRVNGVVNVTVRFVYPEDAAEPLQSTDPASYTFDITSGPVPDPIVYKEVT